MVHQGHSPGVVELNSMQLAHRQEVAPLGRSYGCGGENWQLISVRHRKIQLLVGCSHSNHRLTVWHLEQ